MSRAKCPGDVDRGLDLASNLARLVRNGTNLRLFKSNLKSPIFVPFGAKLTWTYLDVGNRMILWYMLTEDLRNDIVV